LSRHGRDVERERWHPWQGKRARLFEKRDALEKKAGSVDSKVVEPAVKECSFAVDKNLHCKKMSCGAALKELADNRTAVCQS